MQDSYFQKIHPTIRIINLIILIIMIFFAKSFYLNVIICIAVLFLLILTGRHVKEYIKVIKKILPLLLFFSIVYIIILGNISKCIFIIYKILIIVLLFKNFILNINFERMHTGINGLMCNLKNSEKISYDLTLGFYFLIILFNSSDYVLNCQKLKNKVRYNLKSYFLPKIIYTSNQINKLKFTHTIRYYKLKKEKINKQSIIFLLFMICLFVITLIKEVLI